MFKRPHHNSILKVLKLFNKEFLLDSDTCFAGGTAISLKNNEYRESIDIDFLCFSSEGYRKIREQVSNVRLGEILPELSNEVSYAKEVKRDRYGIRCAFLVDGINIRFEIVSEARQAFLPTIDTNTDVLGLEGFPMLSDQDLLTQKLLAISDRGTDKFNASRDVFDFIVLMNHKEIDYQAAFLNAFNSYGKKTILSELRASINVLMSDESYYEQCLNTLNIDKKAFEKELNNSTWISRIEDFCITPVIFSRHEIEYPTNDFEPN